MCGIAGLFSTKLNQTASNNNLISAILESQHSRGPDNRSQQSYHFNNAELILGHNRLAILDLDKRANQPFSDPNNNISLVFNGEIYNYIEIRQELQAMGYEFITTCDTEVVVNSFLAWGIDCLNHFNGMFAMAIYDKRDQSLWLVRDRFGIKPLYYYYYANQLIFASSSNVIAKHLGLEPNLAYVSRGLHYWFYDDNTDATAYNNLYQVPAGMHLKFHIDRQANIIKQEHHYYDFQTKVTSLQQAYSDQPISELLEATQANAARAIQHRLRADVPVGVSLSGGFDSSYIAAKAAKLHPNIIGFTFGHPDQKKSEGPLVAELARHTGINVNYISPTKKELLDAFWYTLNVQDSPFASCSIVAQNLVYRTAQQHGVKVILGGQGGDEGFLGYRKFFLFHLKSLLKKRDYPASLKFITNIVRLIPGELGALPTYWQLRHRYLKHNQHEPRLNLPLSAPVNLFADPSKPLFYRQIADITQYSLPTLLRYEDRNSMSHSIESRLPFLDYQLLENACALPVDMKIKHGYGKWVMRELAQGVIPDSIRLARYKRGFDVPTKLWIDAGLGQSIRSHLEEHKTAIDCFLPKTKSISELFSDEQLAGNRVAMHEAICLSWLANKY